MMRVLHAALMAQYEPGVIQQMQWEDDAAVAYDLAWDARLFVPRDSGYPSGSCVVTFSRKGRRAEGNAASRIRFWLDFRKAYYAWLEQQAKNYDLILLRQSMSDPFRALFIKGQKRPVISVHHTLEIPELKGRGGFAGQVRAVAESCFGSQALRVASGVVGVTEEIRNYELSRLKGLEKASFVYPNGIMLGDESSLIGHEREGAVSIIFVASHFVPWHGLDLLLNDLKSCTQDFRLHLVGRVSEKDMRLIDGDSRVVVHGLLKAEQIRALTDECDVGLASFALQRKGMFEACTLKVREYLSRGVPVYSGHRDVFPKEFAFYKKGSPSFSEIIDFAEACRSYSKREIAKAASPFIEKGALLKRLYEQLSIAMAEGRLAALAR